MRLVYVVLGWLAGILIAAAIPQLPPVFWLCAMTIAIFALVFAWHSEHRLLLLVIAAIALGGYRMELVPRPNTVAYFNDSPQAIQIEGIIVAEPRFRDNRMDVRVEVLSLFDGKDTLDVRGLVLVSIKGQNDLAYGDRIRATDILRTPASYDTFSYADYLARGGVFSVMNQARIEVISHDEGSPILAGILALKAIAESHIANALPDPHAALLTGILLGDEGGIDPQLADDFSAVGASHIIAISGFNMVIVSQLVMKLLARFNRPKSSAMIGIAVLILYTIFVGASAAVVRAALMSSLLVIAPLLKRKTYVPASLAFVVLLLTLINPLTLWDVGFQLSAAAVLGLALFTDPIQRYVDRGLAVILPQSRLSGVTDFLRDPLVVTLAVQITTLPLTILYFQQLSLTLLIVNLLIVPVQGMLLILGGIAMMLSFLVPTLALPLFWVDGLLLGWTIGVVRAFAGWSESTVPLYVDERLIVGYFFIVVGGALLMSARPKWALESWAWVMQRRVRTSLVWSGVSVIALCVAVMASRPDGLLHVWFLDVGHSNAILVQTPDGAQILIDGGAFPSRLLTALGDRMPFYDREIEAVFVTHPDENDIAALPAVLSRYQAGVILTNGHPIVTDAQQQIFDAAGDSPIVEVSAGYEIVVGENVRIEVLHPSSPPLAGDLFNTGSLVLRLHYGDVSFLLTNDVSVEGQIMLLEEGGWPIATVLQVPNHARRGAIDAAFVAVVQPQIALLHNDRANRFGDPDTASLQDLGDVPIYRSDEMGPLHLWSDGEAIWMLPD